MSEAQPAPFEWDENYAWTFEAHVQPGPFNEALRAVAEIVDEARVEIGPDAIHIRAVDPATVAAVDVSKECVRSADDLFGGRFAAGLHVSDLVENAPAYWPSSNECYRLQVTHSGSEEDTCRLIHPTEGEHESQAFDPATCRAAPDPMPHPDEGWEQDATLPAPKVRGLIGAMAETESDLVRLTPLDEKVRAEAITRDGVVKYRWITSAPGVQEGGYEYYSSDYLADIARGLWTDGGVRVQFGEEQPLSLTNDSLQFALAPRVSPDFEEVDDVE